MKTGIHPKFFPEAKVICACGNTWTVGSTREVIHTDMCAQCHPFYTGEQRIVDTEGQVDRFYRKLEVRDQYRAAVSARETAKASPDQPISALNLGPRPEAVLNGAGLTTVNQLVQKLEAEGDESFLAIEGFGRKSLIDMKKRLRAGGFLPETTEPTESTETAPAE